MKRATLTEYRHDERERSLEAIDSRRVDEAELADALDVAQALGQLVVAFVGDRPAGFTSTLGVVRFASVPNDEVVPLGGYFGAQPDADGRVHDEDAVCWLERDLATGHAILDRTIHELRLRDPDDGDDLNDPALVARLALAVTLLYTGGMAEEGDSALARRHIPDLAERALAATRPDGQLEVAHEAIDLAHTIRRVYLRSC